MIKNKISLVFGIVVYLIAALIQFASLIIYKNGIISSQEKLLLLFASVFVASLADFCIIKSISNKILKIVISIHAVVALMGSVVFFVSRIITFI